MPRSERPAKSSFVEVPHVLRCDADSADASDEQELTEEGKVIEPAVYAWVKQANDPHAEDHIKALSLGTIAERAAPRIVIQMIRTMAKRVRRLQMW